MRSVYLMLYKARKKVFEEGGSTALAETPAGGRDLMSSMSPTSLSSSSGVQLINFVYSSGQLER
jgi:hypothetical protein